MSRRLPTARTPDTKIAFAMRSVQSCTTVIQMDHHVAKSAARADTTKLAAGRITPRAALTTSRPELLVDGSDQQFRRLVHSLFGFLVRHQTLREGHAAVIGLPGIEYTTL